MKTSNLIVIFFAVGVFTVILSACDNPKITDVHPLPVVKSELDQPLPTADIKTTDPQDQQLVNELNQYQDTSLDKDLNDLDLQL